MAQFEEIYHQYFDDVYKYVLVLSRDASIAEEITQDTFFKALQNIDQFKGESKLSVWLCQIAKNLYFTWYQKNKRFATDETISQIEEIDLARGLADEEHAFAIHKVLHTLNEPYKEVFMLRTFGELSFQRIGELFSKTDVWARVTYYRAKKKIQEALL